MLTADVGIYSISRLPGCPMSSLSSSSSCWLCYCVFVFLALSQWGRGTGELLRQVKSHTASPYIIMLPIHQSCRLGVLSSWSHDLFVFFLPHARLKCAWGKNLSLNLHFICFFVFIPFSFWSTTVPCGILFFCRRPCLVQPVTQAPVHSLFEEKRWMCSEMSFPVLFVTSYLESHLHTHSNYPIWWELGLQS